MIDEKIEDKLVELSESDVYPFHMPGHKRQINSKINPYSIDITEIENFDNLHDAKGIIANAQEKASKLYGSRKTYYLINGSTCGLLASIFAVTKRGSKVVIARNCHKAVYNAALLRELEIKYIYPLITEYGIQGKIIEEDIENILEEDEQISAVVITSPTYDGVVSNVRKICQIAHKKDIPVIVDGAHGAHLGFSEDMPENPVKLEADLVIESVHKTLPAFTQTALLHVCTDRVDRGKIEKYLGIFETSSPSYVLMSGIEKALDLIKDNKVELFLEFKDKRDDFYEKVSKLNKLKVLRKQDFSEKEAYDFDESKIIMMTNEAGISGKRLQEILLDEYQIQLEMSAGNYALAISTIMDTKEGFDRLANALVEIDRRIQRDQEKISNINKDDKILNASIYQSKEKVMEIYEADRANYKAVALDEAIGRISKNYINIYPPGIPLLVPGEKISKTILEDIKKIIDLKLEIQGLKDENRINIVI